jgi:hypothetical protein
MELKTGKEMIPLLFDNDNDNGGIVTMVNLMPRLQLKLVRRSVHNAYAYIHT